MQNGAENIASQHNGRATRRGVWRAAIGLACLGGGAGLAGLSVDPKGHWGASVQSFHARSIRTRRGAWPRSAGWRAGRGLFRRRPRRASVDPEFLGELVSELRRGTCAASRSRGARPRANLRRRREGRGQARARLSNQTRKSLPGGGRRQPRVSATRARRARRSRDLRHRAGTKGRGRDFRRTRPRRDRGQDSSRAHPDGITRHSRSERSRTLAR